MVLGDELGANVVQGFGGTREEIAIRGKLFGEALEEVFTDIGFEIDGDVSTEDDVEWSKIGE